MSNVTKEYKNPDKLWPEVDDYLDVISSQLGKWYVKDEKENVRQEIREHLGALIAEEKHAGKPHSQAIKSALNRFGDPFAIGRELRERRRLELAAQGKRIITCWDVVSYCIKFSLAYGVVSFSRILECRFLRHRSLLIDIVTEFLLLGIAISTLRAGDIIARRVQDSKIRRLFKS